MKKGYVISVSFFLFSCLLACNLGNIHFNAPALGGSLSIDPAGDVAVVGQTLRVNTSALVPQVENLSFEWFSSNSIENPLWLLIENGNSDSLFLTEAFIGQYIKVQATKDGFEGSLTSINQLNIIPAPIPQFTIHFQNGELASMTPEITLPEGSSIINNEPQHPIRLDGWTFESWCTDEAKTMPVNWASYIIYSDTVFYAKWIQDPAEGQYLIRFDNGPDASNTEALYVDSGSALPAAAPANPNREAYTFNGWFYDQAYQSPVQWGVDIPAGNAMLYAKWTLVGPGTESYRIAFDNGPEATSTPCISPSAAGDSVDEPAKKPTRANYTFVQWCSDFALIYPVSWPLTVSGNMTLYAAWTPANPPPPLTDTILVIPDNNALAFQLGKTMTGSASVPSRPGEKTWSSSNPTVY